jgi:glycosyltransferase involved in cell wall biosynthesis
MLARQSWSFDMFSPPAELALICAPLARFHCSNRVPGGLSRVLVSISMKSAPSVLNVVMVVGGFPHPQYPESGVFNARAANALDPNTRLTVVYIRAWRPGRDLIEQMTVQGIDLIIMSVPQVPRLKQLNIALQKNVGWWLLRSRLQEADIIHSVDAAALAFAGSSWAKRADACHVTQVISGATLPWLVKYPRWRKHVHALACNSRELTNDCRRLFTEIPLVRTIWRGTDLDRYSPEGPSLGPLASKPPVRYLFLGGFPPYLTLPHGANTKGGFTLLEAWRTVETELASTGASLLIAGPESRIPAVAAWRDSLKNPDSVFIEGVLNPADVAGYMRASDVVLIPSFQEGLPNVATEAAACGRVVFGSNIGGISDVVEHGLTGLLLEAGDVGGWAAALRDYASRAGDLEQMGHLARKRAQRLFDAREYAPKMMELYDSAIRSFTSGAYE